MGQGGRFGKYGEMKRFDRLRQSRGQKVRLVKELPLRKPPSDFPRPKRNENPKGNKEEG
jgi:hypothetical protein